MRLGRNLDALENSSESSYNSIKVSVDLSVYYCYPLDAVNSIRVNIVDSIVHANIDSHHPLHAAVFVDASNWSANQTKDRIPKIIIYVFNSFFFVFENFVNFFLLYDAVSRSYDVSSVD